jgi:hypothetical protein
LLGLPLQISSVNGPLRSFGFLLGRRETFDSQTAAGLIRPLWFRHRLRLSILPY